MFLQLNPTKLICLELLPKGWFPYDRRRSRIADRRSQKVLRSSAIIWKPTSAIVCDRLRSCDRDRRRSQKIIEPCSIFCDLLRSSAIVCDRLRSCDHMETKVLRSAIETYPIIILILTQMIQRFLATKPECSFMFHYCSVRNTKFSQQCVESPKFLSLHEYFSNSKPMFPSLLKLTMQSLQD